MAIARDAARRSEDRTRQPQRQHRTDHEPRAPERDAPHQDPSPIARLHHRLGNHAVQRLHRGGALQPSDGGTQTADAAEREAERVADEVLRMDAPATDTTATQPTSTTGVAVGSPGGRRLPRSMKQFFAPRFGVDLSGVRLHEGPTAAARCDAIDATAFTFGRDVYFGDGALRSGSPDAMHTMAHELTHVIQQGRVARGSAAPDGSLRPLEHPSPGSRTVQRQAVDVPSSSEPPGVGDARVLHLRIGEDGRVELLVREPGLPTGTIGLGLRFGGDGPELVGSGDPLELGETYSLDDVQSRIDEALGGETNVTEGVSPFGFQEVEGDRAIRLIVERSALALAAWDAMRSRFPIPELQLRSPLFGGEPLGPGLDVDTDLRLGTPPSKETESSEEPQGTAGGLELRPSGAEFNLRVPTRELDLGVPDLVFPSAGSALDPTRLFPSLEGAYEFESVPGSAVAGLASSPPELRITGPLSSSEVDDIRGRFGVPGGRSSDCEERYLIYSNDGNLPNIGSGSDHWLTAFLQFGCRWNPEETGYSDAAFVLEMVTPPGILPPGAPRDASQRYAVPYDLWMGLVYGTFEYQVASVDDYDLTVTWHVGANSLDAGKEIQDFIHEHVSDSPFFPWPSGIEPYLGLGAGFERRAELFDTAVLKGQIVFGGEALASTHRSRGELSAMLELQSASWSGPGGEWRLKGGIGGAGRVFARYGDQRPGTVAGAEYEIETRIGFDLGNFGVELFGTALTSTDPAAQALEDFASTESHTSPLVLPGFLAPEGHFGTGGIEFTYIRRF